MKKQKKTKTLDFNTKLRLGVGLAVVLCFVISSIFSKSSDGSMSGLQVTFATLFAGYVFYCGWWVLRKKYSMSRAGSVIINSGVFCVVCIIVSAISSNAVLSVLMIILLLIGILCLFSATAYEIVQRFTKSELVKDKALEEKQTQRYIDTVAPKVDEPEDFSRVDEYGNPLDENGDGIKQDL